MDNDRYAPQYVLIADHFRELIKSGELRRNEDGTDAKLPSEREISERWGVSHITARAAINVLRTERLVYSERGAGTFVNNDPPLTRIAPERYFRPHEYATYVMEAERAGRNLSAEHATIEEVATADVAERLGIDEGDPVTRTRYLIKMGGPPPVPVSISSAWEPLVVTRGTAIELPHEGPYAGRGIVPRFDAIGVHVDEVEESLTWRSPTSIEASMLELGAGMMVVEIKQTFRAGALAVETADVVFAAGRYDLTYRMKIPL